jgi:phosphoenolpyruvate-protein kinase (PTS system EI component)
MAADPALVILFLGLGIREFSMGPRTVPMMKEFLRGISTQDAERVARAALSLSTADEVSTFLAQELHDLAGDGAPRTAMRA